MDELVKGVKGFSWFLPLYSPFFVFGGKTLRNPSHPSPSCVSCVSGLASKASS